ncbi:MULTISPECIES: hypothetical protein [unclassified Pseudomonas]|uniref:hypothetical protein n=1 Tax=unclassified Pseudomonas TaxID=196821 RepID=UPI0008717993|nr:MULTISPECIES: hypothetical protein [unclassified Pseudomonas]SCW30010.1 hypothetical protein SAMN03159481_00253 [Pseudomonas sp. NFACC56-3]SFK11874.1 hypothetical protein SAMN03159473_00252 [Pseudomonas sp. NFACC52]
MLRDDTGSDGTLGIGVGYAIFQLSKAFIAQGADPVSENHAKAVQRIARWQQVLAHAVQGSAQYGSRMPLADIPVWVTLEVATGGFATGHLLAGGDLNEHERALTASIPGVRPGFERLDINAWYLTDEGLEVLWGYLAKGNYRVDVPEESALLSVAWLLGQQRVDEAWALIETITPYFDRLRFFPAPCEKLQFSAAQIHVFDVGDIRQRLLKLRGQPRVAIQKQVVEVCLPLYDTAVSHFLLTYQNEWPCRVYPEGWHEQAASLCTRFNAVREAEGQTVGASKRRLLELFALLEQCSGDSSSLTGRQVGRIRQIVDDFVRKHGLPDSNAHREFRLKQREQVAAPGHHVIAKAVAMRMEQYPASDGVSDLTPLLEPITTEEANVFALTDGADLPQAIRRRVERCRSGTIAELIDHGLITSGDTVARVLPAMTAEIRSSGFSDPALGNLYAATYRAFRQRRSLLLLNLQSQVRLGELPWVAAIEGYRQRDPFDADIARQALIESSALTLSAFPQAIIPNKLLKELRALAETAGLDLPFVDEVASDIFMGEFSNKFIDAARRAAKALAGTLYARYYDIDTDRLATLPDRPRSRASQPFWRRSSTSSDALTTLCARRANAELNTWRPATNGTIIEQQQILTTQNLSMLFCELDLKTLLYPRLSSLVQACFEWICRRQQMRIEHYHGRLIMLKNTAYAWRQMIFYLSMLDESEKGLAIEGIEAHYARQPDAFREKFLPVMIGLRMAAAGRRLPQHEPTAEGARVFLGWTTDSHWLR